MNMLKKVIGVLIVFLLLQVSVVIMQSHAADDDIFNGVDISKNGDGSVVATLSQDQTTLTISGTGEMKDWSDSSTSPWYRYTEKITSVKINEGVTSIGWYEFRDCSSLSSIEIPSSVTSIGGSAFCGCSSINSINIPSSVTSIGNYAFYKCSSLRSINIPNNVTSIGGWAFYECSSLRSINIPSSVTSILSDAFLECSSLSSITVDLNNTKYTSEEGVLFNKEKTEIIKYPEGKKGNNYKLPNSVVSIGFHAFTGCNSLIDLEIPNNVTSIGRYAFSESKIMVRAYEKSIKIPNILSRVLNKNDILYSTKELTFKNCKLNESKDMLDINSNTSETSIKINDGALSGLTIIIVPMHAIDISKNKDGSVIAQLSEDITTLTISGSGEMGRMMIGWNGYEHMIENIIIEEEVTYIVEYLYTFCTNLISINVDENNTKYMSENGVLFNKDKTVLLKYPSGKKENSYNIPSSVACINEYAFYSCDSLIDLEIPNSVTIIGDYVFYKCNSLIDLKIPNSVISIGNYVFCYCDSLRNVEISSSVIEIGSYKFERCSSLSNINVDVNNKKYMSENGILFDKEKTELIKYPSGKKENSYNIPSSVTSISYGAIEESGSLRNIVIPKEVISIHPYGLDRPGGLNSNLLLICKSETAAEIYAKEKNRPYEVDNQISLKSIDYSTKERTNRGVTVTVTSDELLREIMGWTLSEDRKILTKTYEENTEEEITIMDLVGNERTEKITINNIEKIPPHIKEIKYSIKEPTNKSIAVEIEANEEIKLPEGWSYKEINNKTIITKTYEENTEEEITILDLAGNEIKETIKIENIDKIPPEVAKIKYLPDIPTNQNVIVEIEANEEIELPEGWSYKANTGNKVITKIYNENVEEKVTIKDQVGNEAIQKAQVKVTNIDRIVPEVINRNYSTTEATNQDVTVEIEANEEIQLPEGWSYKGENKGIITKEYKENTTEEITVKDVAGNEAKEKVIVEINNIDKMAPEVEVSYSTKELTNEKVKVTITANEEIQGVAGWTLSQDKKALTKTYETNTTEEITVKDVAGNDAKAIVRIINIKDKIAPEIREIRYSTKEPTNKSVVVEIEANEEIELPEGWSYKTSTVKNIVIKTYTANTTEEITIKDLAGNESKGTIKITNIVTATTVDVKTYTIENNTIKNIQPSTSYTDFIKNITSNKEIVVKEGNKTVTGTNKIKTGHVLTAGEKSYTLIITGDCNGDGQADIKDILQINKHRLNKAQLTSVYFIAGDVNKDGKVDIKDILQLNKYRLGKISQL